MALVKVSRIVRVAGDSARLRIRIDPGRGDLGQRHQHEGLLRQAGMGHLQKRLGRQAHLLQGAAVVEVWLHRSD